MYTRNPRNHMSSSQKRFNLTQFMDEYHNKPEVCRQFFIDMKYPNGYVCQECGNTKYTWLDKKNCMQCTKCCQQTHILAGTVLEGSKLSFFQILPEPFSEN